MDALFNICSALGLSTAAGLNAYIPLLTLAIMNNRGIAHLAAPYDVLGQPWCIVLLVILLVIEIIVDKVPGADHINDIVHTFIRPAAGAVLFASQAGIITSVHPGVWLTIGLLTSGGVHAAKALARPVVNVTTAGIGAPVVSIVEDLVSVTLAIVAILVPILAVLLIGLFAWILFKTFKRLFGRRQRPIAVRAIAVDGEETPQMSNWSGGV